MFGMSLFWKFHKTCTISSLILWFSLYYALRFAYQRTQKQSNKSTTRSRIRIRIVFAADAAAVCTANKVAKKNIFYQSKN